MNYRIKFIAFFLVLQSGRFLAAAQLQHSFQTKNYSFSLQIDSFDNKGIWGASDSTVKLITVRRLRDNKIIQQIIPEENYITDNKHELVFDDFNFDGFDDFKLFSFEAKHAQTCYLFYLFDPKKGKFYYSKEIADALDDAAIDKKNKTLSKINRLMGGDYELVVYRFIQNKLTLIEQREDKSEGENVLITERKRINGKMKLLKKIRMTKADYAKSEDRLMPI